MFKADSSSRPLRGRALISMSALVCAIASVGCERTTTRHAHEVNGQVFYTETTSPSIGESFFNAIVYDCAGGVKDDDRAVSLVPTRPSCPRENFIVSYTVDGIYSIESCDERWRIRCVKSTTAATGSSGCANTCSVDDHFTVTK